MKGLLIAMTALALGATGCQKDSVQISRVGGLSPLVLPFPPGNENKLKAAVKNFGSERWNGGILRAMGFYNPNGQATIDPAHTVLVEHTQLVPALDPGQEVEVFAEAPISSLQLQGGSIPAVPCVKGACNGHLHLTLEDPSAQQLPGPNTEVSISWANSGEAKDLVVVDESKPRP